MMNYLKKIANMQALCLEIAAGENNVAQTS